MLWGLLLLILVAWAGGFALDVGGGLIHLLLVIALVVAIVQLTSGLRGGGGPEL